MGRREWYLEGRVPLGERDTLVPAALADVLAPRLPAAEFALMAGAGHAPFLSHPEAFLEILQQFLNRAGVLVADDYLFRLVCHQAAGNLFPPRKRCFGRWRYLRYIGFFWRCNCAGLLRVEIWGKKCSQRFIQ